MDNQTLYYDIVKFETKMAATRSNFMLLFQSLLISLSVQLFLKESHTAAFFLAFIGIILSLITMYLNWKTYIIANAAEDKLRVYDDRVQKLFDEVAEKSSLIDYRNAISTTIIYIIPLLILLTWVGLIILL